MLDTTHKASPRTAATALRAARVGIARAVGHVRLVVLVWFVFLALAWVAAMPAWRWFNAVLSLAPEGDRLLGGLNIALLRELTHYDRSPTMAIALGSSYVFFALALILNPFVAGGTLAALRQPSSSRQFVAEGARYYWPFARILLIVGMLGGGLTLVLAAGLEAAGAAFDEDGWARATMWTENLTLLMWLMVFGVCSLIIDIARIMVMRRDDVRGAVAVRQALAFLWRHLGAVLMLGAAFLVMLAAAIVVYNLIAGSITPLSWGLIAFTIIWQQLFALTRTTLRIGLLAALTELVDAREPLVDVREPLADPHDSLADATLE